ncbi:MAG: chromosome segregation protein [Bacillota bacterium]|jgi:chromosome segregation protein|nr:chromosome segregation protein [Bacillota bacterium]MDK2882164.1 chromosome segregation protein [Bacillota bacterium]MDK2960301.1 chromosome segregation protein [Bacillota bacterium]
MYLERLTIQGFKSFAERLELVFEPGISAIVGPNGSGKSNIVDAIRWALGEQSLHALRGERLEDIIFNGSDHRRAHGLAEVTLTFANADGGLPVPYSEVVVTRRAYRSGSSEFFLNGVPCRLRDIQELFWDTGLGREGYSFIGQGRVEEVLNLKPEERRVFLEQAAGVWKYRQRKKEAISKLAEIDQDLLRLGDLIAELERQRGPLAEEARRAEIYQERMRRLKELKVFLGLSELRDLERELREAEEKLQAAKADLAALAGQRSQMEAKLEEEKLKLAEKEARWEDMRRAAGRLEEEIAALTKNLDELAAAERERKARLEAIALRKAEVEEEKAHLLNLTAQEKAEQEAVSAELKEKGVLLQELEKKLKNTEAERASAARELAARRERIIALMSERALKGNTFKALEHEEARLNERRERVRATGQAAAERLAELRKARDNENAALAAAEKELSSLTAKREDCAKQLGRAREMLDAIKARQTESWRSLERLKMEFAAEKKMAETHEGYGQGPRAVLNARLSGIHGAVADLLEVPAGLELALEAALGAAQEYLVAETDEDAAAAIAWLKEKKVGRATFLPLNTVRPAEPRPEERRLAGQADVVGWASELVSFAPEHRPVVQHLLGRVLVARTLDAARAVARAAGFRLKIVTLEGDLLNPGGSMSGGSRRCEQRSLLARTRRLRELEEAVAVAQEKLARIEAAVEAARARAGGLEVELSRLTEEIGQKKDTIDESRRRLTYYEAQLNETERAHATWEEEAAALEQALAELAKRREVAESEWKRLEAEVGRWEREIRAWEEKEAQLGLEVEGLREKVTRLRLAIAAAEEKSKQLIRREEERQAALRRLEQELAAQGERARELAELGKAAARERGRLEREKAAKQKAWALEREKMDGLAAEVEELKTTLSEGEKAVRTLRRQEEGLRQELYEREVGAGRLVAKIEETERRLFETLGVPVGAPLPEVGVSIPGAQAEVKRLEGEIESLGEVNLQAPRALAELEERYNFLSQQVSDLQAARTSLERMMREIDRTVASRMEDTHTRLRANFQEVFKRLFGGGQADLVLTGTKDFLTAGIDIWAQLPGKKMQPLSLLSGGERALTAIAFLFALLRSRSTHLCVLDEIDAALDEANAARFLNYLEELAQNTQFIMITHRKQAMLRARSLYGLAMGASGASRLVSIRLEEAV